MKAIKPQRTKTTRQTRPEGLIVRLAFTSPVLSEGLSDAEVLSAWGRKPYFARGVDTGPAAGPARPGSRELSPTINHAEPACSLDVMDRP